MIIARIVYRTDSKGNTKPSIVRPFSLYSDIKMFIRANRDTVLKVVDRAGVRI